MDFIVFEMKIYCKGAKMKTLKTLTLLLLSSFMLQGCSVTNFMTDRFNEIEFGPKVVEKKEKPKRKFKSYSPMVHIMYKVFDK